MLNITKLLEHSPDWLRRRVNRVLDGRGGLGRMADAVRFRSSEHQAPPLPHIQDAAVRLFIGPDNAAGQAYEWARAVERSLPGTDAIAMLGTWDDIFQPAVDLKVPVVAYDRSVRWHADLEAFLARHTHVVWESGHALLGRRYDYGVAREAARLEQLGVRGALLFHGSDIRPPSRHAEQNPWSPFRSSTALGRALEAAASKNAAMVAEAGLPVFVSTPDLLQWLPNATWCPVVVDSSRWRAAAQVRASSAALDGPPVVAHAPSNQWLKGTDRIEPMLRRLADEGVIQYRQIVGVPHASMPEFYAEADIVLDQFVLGIYGVAACEAMASGRLVISHVDEPTRTQVRERMGVELPVYESTIETLEKDLRYAVAEPEAFEEYRTAGPAFIHAVHDGRRSAQALAPFLGLGV